jgi:hypothetical protein
MIDRYAALAEEILAVVEGWRPGKPSEDRHAEMVDLLRTRARSAVLRSICDHEGHRPDVLIRMRNAADQLVLTRVCCTFCGVELREVEE